MNLGHRLILAIGLGATSVTALTVSFVSSPHNYERTAGAGVVGLLLLVAYFACVASILVTIRSR